MSSRIRATRSSSKGPSPSLPRAASPSGGPRASWSTGSRWRSSPRSPARSRHSRGPSSTRRTARWPRFVAEVGMPQVGNTTVHDPTRAAHAVGTPPDLNRCNNRDALLRGDPPRWSASDATSLINLPAGTDGRARRAPPWATWTSTSPISLAPAWPLARECQPARRRTLSSRKAEITIELRLGNRRSSRVTREVATHVTPLVVPPVGERRFGPFSSRVPASDAPRVSSS